MPLLPKEAANCSTWSPPGSVPVQGQHICNLSPYPTRTWAGLGSAGPVQDKASGCSASPCCSGMEEAANHLKFKSISRCVCVVFWESLTGMTAENSSNTWVSTFPFLWEVLLWHAWSCLLVVNVLRAFSQGQEWREEVRMWGRGNVTWKCLLMPAWSRQQITHGQVKQGNPRLEAAS